MTTLISKIIFFLIFNDYVRLINLYRSNSVYWKFSDDSDIFTFNDLRTMSMYQQAGELNMRYLHIFKS